MTDNVTEAPEEKEAVDLDVEESTDIPLERCNISFMINVRNVESLAEALDIAAVNLGRYGMNSFYILATDPDTDRQWIISDGEVMSAEEVEALGLSDGS